MAQNAETISFTGTLSIRRIGAMKMALLSGYRVSRSVTRNTTLLVFGSLRKPSKKMERAIKYGIRTIKENEFFALTKMCEQLYLSFRQ